MQMQYKSTSVKAVKAVKARELTWEHVRKSRAMQMQCKSTSVKAVQGLWATTHKARYRKTWANQVFSFRSEARTVQAKMNWDGLPFFFNSLRVPTSFLKPQRCSNQHFIKIITVFHNFNLEAWLNEDSVCSVPWVVFKKCARQVFLLYNERGHLITLSLLDSNAAQSDSEKGERGIADEAISTNGTSLKFEIRKLWKRKKECAMRRGEKSEVKRSRN